MEKVHDNYKIGDRVTNIEFGDGNVNYIDSDSLILVEFDVDDERFHSGVNRVKSGRGYWMMGEDLNLIKRLGQGEIKVGSRVENDKWGKGTIRIKRPDDSLMLVEFDNHQICFHDNAGELGSQNGYWLFEYEVRLVEQETLILWEVIKLMTENPDKRFQLEHEDLIIESTDDGYGNVIVLEDSENINNYDLYLDDKWLEIGPKQEVKDVTLEEIEEELGYKINIV